MSSTMDEFDCPKCGRMATREQDNKSGDVHVSCRCGWTGEEVAEDEKRPAEYTKHITGFVSQNFELVNGKYVCVGQIFTASDQEEIEDEFGDTVDTDGFDEEEVYQPMDMIQPESTTKKMRKKTKKG